MKKYYFLDCPDGFYSCPKDVPGGSVNDEINIFEADCNVIYDIYDDLANRYSDYVTKTKMGSVSGYDFNKYTFKNYEMENVSDYECKPFKVIITTAVHGYEPGCAWTTAHFFKLMCENPDDKILGFLRRNVIFEVLPLVNPYGFSKNIRANENGTDINRNFDCEWISIWDKEHGYYAGDYPHSETETLLVDKFLKENSDAEVMIDYHNISRPYPLIYVDGSDAIGLAYSVFNTLSHKWQNEYETIQKNCILGSTKRSGQGGMLAKYARRVIGLNSFTLETPEGMEGISTAFYDENTIHTALEVLVNTILAIVKSYR